MDTSVIIGFITVGMALIGSSSAGLIWAIRQEGRINGHDKLFEERKLQTDDKIDAFCDLQQQRHEDLIHRLERIERKQDASNGR